MILNYFLIQNHLTIVVFLLIIYIYDDFFVKCMYCIILFAMLIFKFNFKICVYCFYFIDEEGETRKRDDDEEGSPKGLTYNTYLSLILVY